MSTDPRGPRLLLPEHHRETEGACMALLARTYADDSFELVAQYRCFERALLEHIAAEEELILPAYAEYDPVDAKRIHDDHGALRDAMYRLGVEVDLHLVRARSVQAVVDGLRAHAAHEDAGLYPWAQVHLGLPQRRQLFVRIGKSLRALARFRTRRAA